MALCDLKAIWVLFYWLASLLKRHLSQRNIDLIWQALKRFSTKTLFTPRYRIALAPARKPYRIEILFTHTNSAQFRGDFYNGAMPSLSPADRSLKWRVISDRCSYCTGKYEWIEKNLYCYVLLEEIRNYKHLRHCWY